jgi:hypothetical protein
VARSNDPVTDPVADPPDADATAQPAKADAKADPEGPTIAIASPHYLSSFDPSVDDVEPVTQEPRPAAADEIEKIRTAVKAHNDATGEDIRLTVKGA